MSMIKVKNLKKQFQIGSEIVNAIKDISFEVNAGEFISIANAFIGNNNKKITDKNFKIVKQNFYNSRTNMYIFKSIFVS